MLVDLDPALAARAQEAANSLTTLAHELEMQGVACADLVWTIRTDVCGLLVDVAEETGLWLNIA